MRDRATDLDLIDRHERRDAHLRLVHSAPRRLRPPARLPEIAPRWATRSAWIAFGVVIACSLFALACLAQGVVLLIQLAMHGQL